MRTVVAVTRLPSVVTKTTGLPIMSGIGVGWSCSVSVKNLIIVWRLEGMRELCYRYCSVRYLLARS